MILSNFTKKVIIPSLAFLFPTKDQMLLIKAFSIGTSPFLCICCFICHLIISDKHLLAKKPISYDLLYKESRCLRITWISGELGCFVLAKKWMTWIRMVCKSCCEGWEVLPATESTVGSTLSKNTDKLSFYILSATTIYLITKVIIAWRS